jgi:peptidoglycan/LPS O-acetylase OafA/YrhL
MKTNKRFILILATIALMVIGTIVFVIIAGGFDWQSIAVIAFTILVLAFAIPKIIRNRNDLVNNDEYSRKVLKTVASRSYVVSLYTWLIMMYFSKMLDDLLPETTTKIAFGIGIMILVFVVNFIIVKISGVRE